MNDRDRRVLEIAAAHWKQPGAREHVIRTELGVSPARFAQILGALLEDAEAEAACPVLVRRLRRVRDARRVIRASA